MALTPEQIDEIAGPADYFDRRVFASAIEAEVRKQDDALIQQLVQALEGSVAITMVKIDQRNAALTAGRAWLKDKP